MLSISFYEACEIVSRYSHTLDEITIFVFQLAIRPGVFSLFSFFLLLFFFSPSLSSRRTKTRVDAAFCRTRRRIKAVES